MRQDFEKIYKSKDEQEVNVMLDKYEHFIERYFEPYAAMHESRPHSNLWGKNLLFNDTALQTDQIGYYKPVSVTGEPTSVHFLEQYPHMVTAWVYDHKYLSDDFNYDDLEKKYLDDQTKTTQNIGDLKQQLDEAHK